MTTLIWATIGACRTCGAPFFIAQGFTVLEGVDLPPPLIASCKCHPGSGMPSTAGLWQQRWEERLEGLEKAAPIAAQAAPNRAHLSLMQRKAQEGFDTSGKPHPADHLVVLDFAFYRETGHTRCVDCGWTRDHHFTPTEGHPAPPTTERTPNES